MTFQSNSPGSLLFTAERVRVVPPTSERAFIPDRAT
jgi:hypothetical protein